MNKVILVGNLTRDPELAETNSGVTVCKFSIAVNRPYSDKDGNRECDFINIVTWRNQAENCGKFLKRGSKVAIVGNIQNRSYEDKEGNKRTVTEVMANEVEFLTAKSVDEDEPKAKKKVTLEPVSDDDLPF